MFILPGTLTVFVFIIVYFQGRNQIMNKPKAPIKVNANPNMNITLIVSSLFFDLLVSFRFAALIPVIKNASNPKKNIIAKICSMFNIV